jgi:Cdc6-like AAA superfamily ATPase
MSTTLVHAASRLAERPGGSAFAVWGNLSDDAETVYFVGASRSDPPRTLLDAALSVLAGPRYARVIVATQAGGHMPDWTVSGKKIGRVSGVWLLRGEAFSEGAARAAQPPRRYMPDLSGLARPRPGDRFVRQTPHEEYLKRAFGVIQEIARQLGSYWDEQNREFFKVDPAAERILVVVDAHAIAPSVRDLPGFLAHYPEAEQQARDSNLARLESAFRSLPELCRALGADIALLAPSQTAAARLAQPDEGFVVACLRSRRSANSQETAVPAQSFDQIEPHLPKLSWPGATVVNAPQLADLCAFGDFYPRASASMPLYDLLRRVPPRKPQDPVERFEQDFVGMDEVKLKIGKIVDVLKANATKRALGANVEPPVLSAAFIGNPGTGKTTAARLLARIYRETGMVRTDTFIHTTRQDLVGPYIGHTEKIIKDLLEEAKGGVLLIDEAHGLAGEGNDFGQHVIRALLPVLANPPFDPVIFVAGYPKEMDKFFNMDPGLKGRFLRENRFHFTDYTDPEMVQILHKMISQKGYRESGDLEAALLTAVMRERRAILQEGDIFANGRVAEHILRRAEARQARRINAQSSIGLEEAMTLIADDFNFP